MNPERFKRIETLFQAAIELPSEQRAAWLALECRDDLVLLAEVQQLLDNDDADADAFVQERVRHAVTTLATDDCAPLRRAGPYQLLRQIGSGGMGTVWLAQRADEEYRSTVAVKLVRPGMDTEFILNRFRRERQILAQLAHPNIGRLLDGGTTLEGIPYIVMEYIDGVRITEFCDRHALNMRDRVSLFLYVCAAVSYAHQNLVLHRDLKPGNVLVDASGTPKLLDFGIGKLLLGAPAADDVTLTRGVGMMTPDYASPEQVQGDAVGVASDIYSLGAILYELATGVGPHAIERYTPQAIEEAVCRREVVRPSQRVGDRRRAKELAGDLDTIILKALHKEPERRYATVSEFSEDMRRYLEYLPVRARPDTRLYAVRKFARRHRLWVSAAALVVMSLIVGTSVAMRQAQIATASATQVRELARAVIFDVHDAVRDVPGATKARAAIVSTALQYLDGVARNARREPALVHDLVAGYVRIGDVQGNSARGPNLGDTTGALASYTKAAGVIEDVLRSSPRDRRALFDRATVLQRIGDVQAAGTGAREALTSYEQSADTSRALLLLDPGNRDARALLAEVLMESGRLRRQASDMKGALAEVEEAMRAFDALHKESPDRDELLVSLASAEQAMGLVLARLDRLREAAAHYEKSAAYYEELAQRQPANVRYRRNLMIAYSHIGDIAGFPTMANLNDPVRAETAYSRMAVIARELRQADANDARSAVDYGIALMRLGTIIPDARFEDKLTALEESRAALEEGIRRRAGDLDARINHAYVSIIMAELLRTRGQATEALAVNRRSVEVLEPALGATNPMLVNYYVRAQGPLAEDRARRGDRTGALALTAKLVAMAEREAAAQNDTTVVGQRAALPRAYAFTMAVHAALGQTREADAWRQKALVAWKALEDKAGFVESFRREMRALEDGTE